MTRWTLTLATIAFASFSSLQAGAVYTTATSSTIAGLQPTIDAFRNSILGPVTEVNWDDVPNAFADPGLMPATFYVNDNPLGMALSGSVTGFRVSASPGSGTATLFESFDGAGQGNNTYNFQAFSSDRLFATAGGTQFVVTFFQPGTGFTTPQPTTAFGIIFVDNTHNTFPLCGSINPFNGSQSLGFSCASPSAAGGFSFIGATATDGDVFTSVRINAGNATLGTPQDGTHDVVVMDNIFFATPGGGSAVPEPSTLLTVAAGVLAAYLRKEKRS